MEWKYFISPKEPWYAMIASNGDTAYIFSTNGSLLRRFYSTDLNPKNIEVSLEDAVERVLPQYRDSICNFLSNHFNISVLPETPIEVSEEIKNKILKKLISHKAFNGDSAHKFSSKTYDKAILSSLVKQGIIKTIYVDRERRYFVERT